MPLVTSHSRCNAFGKSAAISGPKAIMRGQFVSECADHTGLVSPRREIVTGPGAMLEPLRGDGADLLQQAEHVQLGPLLHDPAFLHTEHVDAAQLDGSAGRGHSRQVAGVDATPGNAVGHEVALRDLIVNLVGVAGQAIGDAADEMLEGWAVHRRLAGHVRHEVRREDLCAPIGCAVVVADGAAHQGLVGFDCHDLLLLHAAVGAGTTPSCCNMPSWSQLVQSSTHFPRSSKRAMTITPTSTWRPVGGIPSRLPVCVPRSEKRPATRSPSATTCSTGQSRAGIPSRNARMNSFSPVRVGAKLGPSEWVT